MFITENMPDAKIDQEMSKLWYFGHVISSSSGFHAEYGSDDLSLMLDIYRLLFLGDTREEATRMIIRLTKQHLYVKELEEL